MIETSLAPRLDGVVIGVILKMEGTVPFVVFAGNPAEFAVKALTTQLFEPSDVGSQVALSFEHGDAARPIILGKILGATEGPTRNVKLDDTPPQPIDLTAQDELTLRCGKASITLTKEGKIILRGTYISSRSSGPNRIKGGSVHLN
ncbi:MAG: DUF6484 domain-containing protein [Litoreibacter sp.]